MAVEDRMIPTRTSVTTNDAALEIFVRYFPEGSIDLRFFIPTEPQVVENVSFMGGDLGYTYENINALFAINSDGNLIVNAVEPNRYNIDEEGDLIYTL